MQGKQRNVVIIPTLEEISDLLDQKLDRFAQEIFDKIGEQDELLDIDGVRRFIGGRNGKEMCSSGVVHNLRKTGRLEPAKLGDGPKASVRFWKSDVIKAINTCKRNS